MIIVNDEVWVRNLVALDSINKTEKCSLALILPVIRNLSRRTRALAKTPIEFSLEVIPYPGITELEPLQ